jgi:protoporphyrinogen oxidase
MKTGILGAGISGIAAASMIMDAGLGDVCLLEKEEYPGGLASSRVIDGYVFDLHGGHVFNTPFPEVRRWVFDRMPEDQWIYQRRNAKSLFKGKVIDYPFEFALYQLDPKDGQECLDGFRHAGVGDEPENYYDWLIWKFGPAIAAKYMIPYNEKIMSYDLKDMSSRWVRGKMPLPSLKDVERAFYAQDPSERVMPHAAFHYPRRGGIQSMIDRISAPVRHKIVTRYTAERVERLGGQWVINGEHRFDRLITTIPLKALIRMMPQAPSDVKRAALGLKTNAVTTTLCTCAPNDISWLYIPDKSICFHRMVFQGNLSPENCPAGQGSSVMIESTGKLDPQRQACDANTKLKSDAFRVGRIIGSTYADSYIVYDKDCMENLAVIRPYIESAGIRCLGRFAEWQYYNMDVCIKKAFECVEHIRREVSMPGLILPGAGQ